jgi:hypothetical protein
MTPYCIVHVVLITSASALDDANDPVPPVPKKNKKKKKDSPSTLQETIVEPTVDAAGPS